MNDKPEEIHKILIVCSTLDLDYPYGATPYLWQLYKGLSEAGWDVIITPYRGRPIRSLWWRCYKNPCRVEGNLFASIMRHFPQRFSTNSKKSGITTRIANYWVRPKWEKHILNILRIEKDIEAVLFVTVPLNHLKGITKNIKKKYDIPLIYYDVDVPISLLKVGGFSFNSYVGSDVSEYDGFIIPSENYVPILKEMGAKKVFVLHFGVDPQVYYPLNFNKDIDIFFFGNRSEDREEYLKMMVSEPSRFLNLKIQVSGRLLFGDFGNANLIPMVPFNSFKNYCCRSKINLNIVRNLQATSFTSISRPFELAALECCVVSAPHKGLDKWFRMGKEMFMVENSKEAIETYKWLIDDAETRMKVGKAARRRVLEEHTITNRCNQLLKVISGLK